MSEGYEYNGLHSHDCALHPTHGGACAPAVPEPSEERLRALRDYEELTGFEPIISRQEFEEGTISFAEYYARNVRWYRENAAEVASSAERAGEGVE